MKLLAKNIKKLYKELSKLYDEELQNVIAILGPYELYKDDRLTVARTREIERFLSQSFFVAEVLCWYRKNN